jgi:hypothetical protein
MTINGGDEFRSSKHSLPCRQVIYFVFILRSDILWNVTPCSPIVVDRRFVGTYCLHLQGRRVSQARNQQEASGKHYSFFYDIEYHYDITLEKLNLQTLHIRRRHIDALFLINSFCGTKYCPSVLETVGLRVPTRNIRNFTTFSCSFSHCPSARSVSAANPMQSVNL